MPFGPGTYGNMPGFGPRPGYRDPLSHGGGFSGLGGPFSSMNAIPSQGMGGGGGGFGGGIGDALKSIAGFFTDPEQGLQRTNLLLGGLGLVADVYGQHQAGRERDRDRKREEEERERDRRVTPAQRDAVSRLLEDR